MRRRRHSRHSMRAMRRNPDYGQLAMGGGAALAAGAVGVGIAMLVDGLKKKEAPAVAATATTAAIPAVGPNTPLYGPESYAPAAITGLPMLALGAVAASMKSRFISIMGVALMGAGAYAGIGRAALAMKTRRAIAAAAAGQAPGALPATNADGTPRIGAGVYNRARVVAGVYDRAPNAQYTNGY